MFNRQNIESFLPFPLIQEQWQEIEQLEDCIHLKRARDADLVGCNFSHLWVIGKAPTEHSKGKSFGKWWCVCDCPEHSIISVRTGNLKSGNTKSCGCHNRKQARINLQKAVEACKVDLTNQTFGGLKALYPTEERYGNSVVWVCQCSCGKKHKVAANYLRAHKIESCGHSGDSRGIRKIKQLLNDAKIDFTTEKTYKDFKFSDTKGTPRFDLYLPQYNRLIEYDGEQHYKAKDLNFFRDSLTKRQEHDRIKNEYCKIHNIPLVRIPYTEIDNLTIEHLLGDKYLV